MKLTRQMIRDVDLFGRDEVLTASKNVGALSQSLNFSQFKLRLQLYRFGEKPFVATHVTNETRRQSQQA
jgi:hypothetical protein